MSFDWDEIDVTDTEVSSRQIIDVPAPLVALAQKSWDSQSLRQATLKTAEMAAEFARLMKGAGDHTDPQTSMYVKQDGKNVKYRAGQRRGRKPLSESTEDDNGTE